MDIDEPLTDRGDGVWVVALPISDLPEGRHCAVDAGDHRVALFNVGGTIYAISDRCSHAKASLAQGQFWSSDCVVECPLHGAEFDVTSGEAVSLPATESVPVYSVKVERGLIHVAVPPGAHPR